MPSEDYDEMIYTFSNVNGAFHFINNDMTIISYSK